jgi:ABC-type multidrug transport system ATPase subunit
MGRLGQLPRVEFRRRADELLERFDLVGAASRPVRTYSGGMRRRLDIAAALVSDPTVLFLDEPTTGLDLQSRNELWNMIRELSRGGTTIVLTTQYLEEADQLADRIAVIDNGRLIANDTPNALKAALGATVIEIGLADASAASHTADIMTSLAKTRVEVQGQSVIVRSNQATATLVSGLHLMEEAALVPISLHVREPSLDDAFLQLTGHGVQPAAAPTGASR